MQNQDVCHVHGGRAPVARAKAAERAVEAEAQAAFARLLDDPEPVTDPFSALALIGGRVLQFEELCREKLAELAEVRSTDAKGAEQVNAVMGLYERALDRAAGVLERMGRLDIDDRMARITASQREVIVGACQAAFDQFGASGRDPELRKSAEQVLARELTAGARRSR